MIDGRNKKKTIPKDYKDVWCELNSKSCIHSAPDDLDNCRSCEEYSFRKYMEYKHEESKYEK